MLNMRSLRKVLTTTATQLQLYLKTSDSTTFQLLNASNTNVPGSATSLSILNVCPANQIRDSFDVQQEFMLRKHAYASDISKAFLRVLVDISSRQLRIFVWFEDPLTMQKPIYFLHNMMDWMMVMECHQLS